MQTRGQQIDKAIEKYEEIIVDLLHYYDHNLKDLVVGNPDDIEKSAAVQISCLLTMSFGARALAVMKDYKIAHDKEVIKNLQDRLKKADPNYKPLEEVYAEQEAAEQAERDKDNDDLEE